MQIVTDTQHTMIPRPADIHSALAQALWLDHDHAASLICPNQLRANGLVKRNETHKDTTRLFVSQYATGNN
jgi:hypothetical protein